MNNVAISQITLSQRLLASNRRFFRWLTKPHIVLSLIMLAVMFVMVVIPLYKLVETTATWQLSDQNIPAENQT